MAHDPKVIDKLRKLLAMAADVGSPNEAATAARMAEKLMRQHNIDNADEIMRELKGGRGAGLAEEGVFVSWAKGAGTPTRHTPPWSHPLAAVLQGLFDVRVLHRTMFHEGKKREQWVFVGYATDVAAAVWTFSYLVDTIVRLSKKFQDAHGLPNGHKLFHHYQRGVAMGVAHGVLRAVEEKQAAQRQHSSSTALVVAKTQAIDEMLSEQGVHDEKKGKVQSPKSHAYYMGIVEGRKVNVNPKTLAHEKERCHICKRTMDDPANPVATKNCGGDCLECMADSGDPECKAALAQDEKHRNLHRKH